MKTTSNAVPLAWLVTVGSVLGILLFGAGQRSLTQSGSLISAFYYVFGLGLSVLAGAVLVIGWGVAIVLAARAQSRPAGWVLAGGAVLMVGVFAVQWPDQAFGPPATSLGTQGPWQLMARVATPTDYQPFTEDYRDGAFPGLLEAKDHWSLRYQGRALDLCKAMGLSSSCQLAFAGALHQSPSELLVIERAAINRFWLVRDGGDHVRLALLGEHDIRKDAADCQISWFTALSPEGDFLRVGRRVLLDRKTRRILPLCALYSNVLNDYPVAISPDRRWLVFGGDQTLRVADVQQANPFHAFYRLEGTTPAAIERVQWRDFWTAGTGDVVRSFDWRSDGIAAREPYVLKPIARP